MGALIKIAIVYVLATLPFAWFLHSENRLAMTDALLYGLRGPYDSTIQVINGSMAALVPLGAFIFILFIGLTIVWSMESSRGGA